MNLFCHAQVRVEVLLGALVGLTLTWRQVGRVLRSVFLLACCCREAEASAVSHFHDGNHTHFPTELLRKMLEQSRALPRTVTKLRGPLSTLLRPRGRRPGWILPLHPSASSSEGEVKTNPLLSYLSIFSGYENIHQSVAVDNTASYFSSPRAESARAVTGRRNSHRWEGGRLFDGSAGFFYGNSCNSGTKSRKIVSKVGN